MKYAGYIYIRGEPRERWLWLANKVTSTRDFQCVVYNDVSVCASNVMWKSYQRKTKMSPLVQSRGDFLNVSAITVKWTVVLQVRRKRQVEQSNQQHCYCCCINACSFFYSQPCRIRKVHILSNKLLHASLPDISFDVMFTCNYPNKRAAFTLRVFLTPCYWHSFTRMRFPIPIKREMCQFTKRHKNDVTLQEVSVDGIFQEFSCRPFHLLLVSNNYQ